jgi:hypothetical protein
MGQRIERATVFLTNFDRGRVDFDPIHGFSAPARESGQPGSFRWFNGLFILLKNISAPCIFRLHT